MLAECKKVPMFQQFLTEVFLTEIKIDIFLGGDLHLQKILWGALIWGDLYFIPSWGDLNIWGDLKSLGGP